MQKDVPIAEILDNPFQPRTTFDRDAIKSLAEEIEAEGFWNGALQGRRNADGRIELVFGHRRLRALKVLKRPTVRIDIVDLTDAQMALRSLEENLQREGLTDLERADAVRAAVELERQARINAGKPERGAAAIVAERLGLTTSWVSQLCDISLTMVNKDREAIEAGRLTAKTALAAKDWGGTEYIRTLARQGKEAEKPDAAVTKPTHMTVGAMKKAVAKAPEQVRERLKNEVFEGKLIRPDEVEARGRRLESQRVRREKEPPPDLKIVIVGWTHDLKDWNRKLRDVEPYMDYVDEVPAIADKFREALRQLIDTAKDLLKSAT